MPRTRAYKSSSTAAGQERSVVRPADGKDDPLGSAAGERAGTSVEPTSAIPPPQTGGRRCRPR